MSHLRKTCILIEIQREEWHTGDDRESQGLLPSRKRLITMTTMLTIHLSNLIHFVLLILRLPLRPSVHPLFIAILPVTLLLSNLALRLSALFFSLSAMDDGSLFFALTFSSLSHVYHFLLYSISVFTLPLRKIFLF